MRKSGETVAHMLDVKMISLIKDVHFKHQVFILIIKELIDYRGCSYLNNHINDILSEP